LAILKVAELNLPSISLGSSANLQLGEAVVAIGTALGQFRHSVTTGVVSGLDRSITASNSFGSRVEDLSHLIQTDAAINPGNSGGPLLNGRGEVVGVNVATSVVGQSVSFAIPIDVVKASLDNFEQTGEFERPFLGVSYRLVNIPQSINETYSSGSQIMEILDGSAASKVGLERGDVIVTVDGVALVGGDLAKTLNSRKVGEVVEIGYLRGKGVETARLMLESKKRE
jgi:S1-C subfamily serine protease